MVNNNLLIRDLAIILRGAKKVCVAAVDLRTTEANKQWENSSLKPLAASSLGSIQQVIIRASEADLSKISKETRERISVVVTGINAYIQRDTSKTEFNNELVPEINTKPSYAEQLAEYIPTENIKSTVNQENSEVFHKLEKNKKKSNNDVNSLIIDNNKHATINDDAINEINTKLSEIESKILSQNINILENVTDTTKGTKEDDIIEKSFSQNITPESTELDPTKTVFTIENTKDSSQKSQPGSPILIGRKPISKNKVKSTLSSDARARKVPHSQLGRLLTFSQLGAGLVFGTMAEMTRRTIGGKNTNSSALLDSSPFLTESNAKRIVDTLCKVRGAALKIGQMLSLTDNAFINPTLQKIFERVRQSADFMPTWQLQRTMESALGSDWRSLVVSFDEKPFAAASIGQVHEAFLPDGRAVAMKIQYPGVADGIESDINNLVSTLKIANIFPEGLYVDEAIRVAKKELRWECDYQREKECTKTYKKFLLPYDDYYVPDVIDELCTDTIFTTELIEGIAVDKCVNMEQETRDRICTLIMRLCLLEVFQFAFMQTDPNWANFFYNENTKQIALLDFGACRSYKKEFVDGYINVIHGAARKDRKKVLEFSRKISFLTGYEAQIMEEAHIDAVMILGEPFQNHEAFDFGSQHITERIQKLIPVMLNHRMCPPPEASYSLHRKMSGVFLLCARLRGRIQCKSYFDNIYNNYRFEEVS